jgi:hypothetical protein
MNLHNRISLAAIVFVCFVASLGNGLVQAEEKAASKIELANGKFVMVAPASWETVPPKSGLVQYEFKAPQGKQEDTARITIMQATGGVDANIDRWIGQFEGAKKSDAKIEKNDVAGATVHTVDISGTYKDSMGGGPFAPGKIEKRDNYRMLGAIIETKDAGTIFLKMTGSQATIEPLAEDFKKALMSLKSK